MKARPFCLTATRYTAPQIKEGGVVLQDPCALMYGLQPGIGWRVVVEQSGYGLIGRPYKSKDELLSDLPRHAAQWGLS